MTATTTGTAAIPIPVPASASAPVPVPVPVPVSAVTNNIGDINPISDMCDTQMKEQNPLLFLPSLHYTHSDVTPNANANPNTQINTSAIDSGRPNTNHLIVSNLDKERKLVNPKFYRLINSLKSESEDGKSATSQRANEKTEEHKSAEHNHGEDDEEHIDKDCKSTEQQCKKKRGRPKKSNIAVKTKGSEKISHTKHCVKTVRVKSEVCMHTFMCESLKFYPNSNKKKKEFIVAVE
ncbi:hypothetical protein RFI_26863 [Reticulomyxa filosa]|uniref:Uncharacterized protein n=1 Tax=Reticulomyxa filosa TaxID=46433 RepID=X6M934_RETFI|nr:hypothetical protein RFI_26863 [Reticulomyxa filosa]|eukprot:ETO10513.1 hypothetical protein RFI_26863 [Reticulomyxa filosa]